MLHVRLEEYDCPHGKGWSWAVETEKGKAILRGEYKTMQEARSYILKFFDYMDGDFIFRRMKRKKK